MQIKKRENLVERRVRFTESQEKILKKLAKKYNLSFAELVREIIDSYLAFNEEK